MMLLIYCLLSMSLVLNAAGQGANTCYDCEANNPCGQGRLSFFFAYCQHPKQFIQCGLSAQQCYYKNCSPGTIWNQTITGCSSDPAATPPSQNYPFSYAPCLVGKYNCKDKNPCTPANAANKKFHFDCEISGKFVQCDESQRCFVKECPTGLAFQPASCTCVNK